MSEYKPIAFRIKQIIDYVNRLPEKLPHLFASLTIKKGSAKSGQYPLRVPKGGSALNERFIDASDRSFVGCNDHCHTKRHDEESGPRSALGTQRQMQCSRSIGE